VTGTANATISRKRRLYVSSSDPASSGIVRSAENLNRPNNQFPHPAEQLSLREPAISNQEGFLIDLHHILSSRTPPPLSEVIDYHSSRPHLRTLRSYNLVLAYAYRLSDFKKARHLLAQMRLERLHDRSPSRTSYNGRDPESRDSVDAEEEFREVVFQGMWTRGGVGRSRRAARSRDPLASTSTPHDNRNVIGDFVDDSTGPVFPISPPERPFQKGSLMDLVYRSVRPHQLRSEDNETIKRIMLDGKVEQQLGVDRRRRKRLEISSSFDSVLLPPPGQRAFQLNAAEKNTKAVSARREVTPLALLPKPIQPKQKEHIISNQTIPEAVLPVFAVQAMLGSATTKPTAELYLACLKYSLRLSPGRSSRGDLREEGFDRPKAGSQHLRGTMPDTLVEIPQFEESIRQLLSLEAPMSVHAGGGKEVVKPHHFLQLLHLYLHPHLASRFPPLRTIRNFEIALPTRFRPLRPTPRTLTYALAALRYQHARHIRALELIQLFRERWGDRTVGLVSWKILAKYGSARRCLKTVTFARDGLERWHKRMRLHSSDSCKLHSAGVTPATSVPSASRIHWKLPYCSPDRVIRRRIQRKLTAMQQRSVPRRMRRISRQSRESAVQNLIDRSRPFQ
jgi:hypothetical protein